VSICDPVYHFRQNFFSSFYEFVKTLPAPFFLLIFASVIFASAESNETPQPTFVQAAAFASSDRVDLSRSMWSSLNAPHPASLRIREALDNGRAIGGRASGGDADGNIARFSSIPMPPPSLSFDGIANLDNGIIHGLLILPPDMNGDIGPDHYVQTVNALIRVFSAHTGEPVSPAFKISDIFAPLGTACSTRNDGLPIVLYDAFADRWLISQTCTAFPPFRQMLAVSKSGDPLGGYFVYEFAMPNIRLNDFPKFGIWSDGYYMSTEEYVGSTFDGSGAFAFDREKLLAGDPSAGYVYFRYPIAAPYRRSTLLPADLDGLTPPPAGAPNIFAGYTATEYGDPQDGIRLFDFHADFRTPENSTFTERPESPLAVAPFDPTSPEGRADIAQPTPGERLDSSSDRLNYRLAYRNFGSQQSLVFNQTVRTSANGDAYRAGVRIYELRRTGSTYAVYEQSTIGDAESSRWVASAAQDRMGNLAVQYNHVSDQKRVSDRYTGRLASEPAGGFRTENEIVSGTGVQKAFGWRWGEYSGLNVDPVSDCNFWATNAYYSLESEQMSDFTWLTRIGRFKFDECTSAIRGRLGGSVINAGNNAAIENARVEVYLGQDVSGGHFTRYSRLPLGSIDGITLPPGEYTVVASAHGYQSRSTTLAVVAPPAASFFNHQLPPLPIPTVAAAALVNESCRIKQASEPGETVTLDLARSNAGAANASSLTAELLSEGGVTHPSVPQVYGVLPADGTVVTRPFTLTVSPTVTCGSSLTLTFRISDGASRLDDLHVELRAGETRYALSENFDNRAAPALPAGWTTSSTPNHQLWRTSTDHVQSAPNALFSPDPLQMGENEVVSPVFSITTSTAEVSFRNWYELETTFLRNRLYDGVVLEIKYGRGRWQDIVSAGGTFGTGGYDGTIDTCCSNPLGGRQGWSGRSGINQVSEYVTTRVKLPPTAVGRDVQLRWKVGTDIGGLREGMYIDDVAVTDGYECTCAAAPTQAPFDFDADGKTDLAVLNFNDGGQPDARWVQSSDGATHSAFWGSTGDVPVNADFDGDGRTDLAIFRSGTWYILPSAAAAPVIVNFGLPGDHPVPADYDGDGKADIAVYRAPTGTWYVLRSRDAQVRAYQFGLADDKPVMGDFDGDSKTDMAVFRPSDGTWYIARSSDAGFTIVNFGLNADVPVPGDYDGDGRTDIAVFRPAAGTWYLLRSTAGFAAASFGIQEDLPLQADFDGDGRADIAVYRPSTGVWWHLRSSDQQAEARGYGASPDVPVPSIYVMR
jgi:hypothetical protein